MQVTKNTEMNMINLTLNLIKRNYLECKTYPQKAWSRCAVVEAADGRQRKKLFSGVFCLNTHKERN